MKKMSVLAVFGASLRLVPKTISSFQLPEYHCKAQVANLRQYGLDSVTLRLAGEKYSTLFVD